MKELQFTKDGNYHVATFTANGRFCLQLLRNAAGRLYVQLRLPGVSQWSPAKLPDTNLMEGSSILWTFDTGVYPMEVRVLSHTEVAKAYVQEVGA